MFTTFGTFFMITFGADNMIVLEKGNKNGTSSIINIKGFFIERVPN